MPRMRQPPSREHREHLAALYAPLLEYAGLNVDHVDAVECQPVEREPRYFAPHGPIAIGRPQWLEVHVYLDDGAEWAGRLPHDMVYAPHPAEQPDPRVHSHPRAEARAAAHERRRLKRAARAAT